MLSPSPRWSPLAKFAVALVIVVVIGALLFRFQVIIGPLVLAFMLAYLLKPLVERICQRTELRWETAVNAVFLTLILLLIAGFTAAGFAIEQQVEGLYTTVADIITHLPEYLDQWTSQPITLGPFTFDPVRFELQPIVNQLIGSIQPLLGRTGNLLTTFFSKAVTLVGWLVFVLAISYYILHDFPKLGPNVDRMAMPGYSGDVQRLRQELGIIWNAFLRGQILLAVTMGIATGVVMTVLGVRYSLVMGLLAGFMEFIPIIGPFISGLIATLVALFQGSNWLGLSPTAYAGTVALAALLLQLLENNLLVPRILGRSLNLHPVAVMIGAIVGASLAGILGLLLSAPMVATARLLWRYTYRKLFDLTPFPDPSPPASASMTRHAWLTGLRNVLRRGRLLQGEAMGEPAPEADDSPNSEILSSIPDVPEAALEGPPTAPTSDSQSPLVLLVDDDPDILELLEVSLKRAGYAVEAAHDGEQALRRLTVVRPTLILLDLLMPGSDGFETLMEMRKITSAPIMVVSALSSQREITRALDAGAADYVSKPFHPAELVSRVAAVLRRAEGREVSLQA